MTGMDEHATNAQTRSAASGVSYTSSHGWFTPADCSNLSDPYSLGDWVDSTPTSNLSHELALAGITTPSSPGSVSFPGIDPQEQPSQRDGVGEKEPWEVPPPRTQLLWAAVDLDGTLSEGVWTPESNGRDIGRPIERNVRKLEQLRAEGMKIVIHTARGWEHYEAIESWLLHHRIHFDRIVCGKLLAAVYVDDRAVESEQWNWLPSAQQERQDSSLDFYRYHQGGN